METGDLMNLHSRMEEELRQKKSLAALIWLIDRGRELEFQVGPSACFLSKSGSARRVSLCENDTEQTFDSMEELLIDAAIGEKPFLEAWKNARIGTIF